MPSLAWLLGMVAKLLGGLAFLMVGLAIGGVWFAQHKIIYPSAYPEGSRETVAKPDDKGFDMPYEEHDLTAPDGTKLKTYLMLTQEKRVGEQFYKQRPTVLYFHANAGNMGHRLPVAKVFVHNLKMNCLMLSYRGYGLSEGKPSEKGIKTDAQTALDFLTNHPVLGKGPIVFFGQSIGGAVAINLAADNPSVPAALILENTFTSITDLIPSLAPPLASFTWLLHQKWDSRSRFLELPADLPILLMSGRKDEIVPAKHMDELAKIANMRDHGNGKPNTVLKKFLEGNHNETVAQKGYFEDLMKFMESHIGRLPKASLQGRWRGKRFEKELE